MPKKTNETPEPAVAETPEVQAVPVEVAPVEPTPAPVSAPVAEVPAPVPAASAAPAPAPKPVLQEVTPAPVPAPAPAPAPVAAPPTPQSVLGEAGAVVPVIDPLAALGLPSMLESTLAEAQNQAQIDDNLGDEESRLALAYAAFPQGKGEKYRENTKYTVFIGRKEDNPQDEVNYFKRVPILYIDSVLIRPAGGKGKPLGGRLMWPTKPDGQRDLEKGVQCQSLDGITPMPRYIGTEVFDFRTGNPFKIGFKRDVLTGQSVPMDNINICAQCPASQWMDIGGKKAQLCKSNWSWIVYDIDKDRMVKVSGGNAGVQMALEGRAKNQMGAKKDGNALVGIEHFFKESGRRQIIVPVENGTANLSPLQLSCVVGVTSGDDSAITPTVATNPDGTRNEPFYTALAAGAVKGVVLSIPVYPYAPQGRPEYVGNFEVPVYPVYLVAVPNNFKLGSQPNPTSVPDFELGTEPLSPEQYAAFLRQRSEYYNQDMRKALLGLEMHERVLDVLKQNAPVQVSAPLASPMLPSVTTQVSAGDDTIEGVFTTPTDVPADA